MRIAIFDYKITRNNPIGSCHLAMLRALAAEHEFTVFAVEFDNPCPEKIRFIRVPSPTRPLALLFVVYHFMAPLCYWLYRLRGGRKTGSCSGTGEQSRLRRSPVLPLLPWHVPQASLEQIRRQRPARVVSLARSSTARLDGKLYLSPRQTGRGAVPRLGQGAERGIPVHRKQAYRSAESHQP